ncbi:MAG: PcfJ domain-containing protein [Lachnospiraceae bacterium]|nr:PcfJ domain-containing protein [Lachnospiraceae bacterium]
MLLDVFRNNNTWSPPEIPAEEMAISVSDDINARQSDEYLYVFQVEPYIDSLYIHYDDDRRPVELHRFAIHEGYTWSFEEESFFHQHCIKSGRCTYSGGKLDEIYEWSVREHPEWHTKRYLTKRLYLIDHIYHCFRQMTVKEMLYKAELDELAANIDEVDEINLLSTKPSDLYEDMPIKVLRSLNCSCGASLLKEHDSRVFIKELNYKFPRLFAERLNDAQCRYIDSLIKGELTVGETGRLFESRRKDLAMLWSKSMFDVFMAKEKEADRVRELCRVYGKMDPIYDSYIKSINDPAEDYRIQQLEYYLLLHRNEYDKAIRRANRKRKYEWQERGDKYYIRYPQTINDFCREALYMHNCLLSYTEAMIKNDTTILFMRKKDDTNMPFITLEIYEGELMQAYHRYNVDCNAEEAKWIRAYCNRHNIGIEKFKFDARIDELF